MSNYVSGEQGEGKNSTRCMSLFKNIKKYSTTELWRRK